MTNSWRAIARMARDRLVQTDPSDLPRILNLWYLRLSALARLRLFNQSSAELTHLLTALSSSPIPPTTLSQILPFELDVLAARAPYWAGDSLGHADALARLLRKCRKSARSARRAEERQMWVERGARVGLIAASNAIEAKDYALATSLLEPLLAQPHPAPALRAALGRIYLQAGRLRDAEAHFAHVDAQPDVPEPTKKLNAALLAIARGEQTRAADLLRDIVDAEPEAYAAVNDLAVVLFSAGKIKEAIDVLESALRASPASLAMAEPFLFNLSTLYELRSAAAADKKRELLVEVAKWSGDGLRTTCLKLSTA
ncbi:hypothetical protein K488DRAFT_46636 [Vararia minispora EC-137]|uniref:Uncharacterized protein n=1 Tax=Vararia minispora EC-137 TaxID=1314806 RepID=A0ACB8QRE1_9AGAM|nr:hypothetical protein K488DRAFT_46636 [Vararia minispora EC-137]